VNIIGTSPQSIEVAEDRKLFAAMLHRSTSPSTKWDRHQRVRGTGRGPGLDIRSSSGRALCWADAPCRSFIATPSCSATCDLRSRPRPNAPCWWTNSGRRHRGGRRLHCRCRSLHESGPGHNRDWRHARARRVRRCAFGDAAMILPPHTLTQKVIEVIRQYTHAMRGS